VNLRGWLGKRPSSAMGAFLSPNFGYVLLFRNRTATIGAGRTNDCLSQARVPGWIWMSRVFSMVFVLPKAARQGDIMRDLLYNPFE
jgi:hypothetical protein